MTKSILILAAAALVAFSGCKKNGRGITSLETESDSLGYSIGYNIAENFSEQKNQLNVALLGKAMRDQNAGSGLFNEEEARMVLNRVGEKIQKGQIQKIEPKTEWYVTGSESELTTDVDSFSYALGTQIALDFKMNKIDANPDALEQALFDFKEKKTLMKKNEVEAKLDAFRNRAQAEKDAERAKEADANLAVANQWLEENKGKPGVKVHESGLQYKEIRGGTGKSPKITDKVTIHYRGTLTNGEEFDSSIKTGQPATFDLARLIQAWQIALPMMKEGAKWELYVPPGLGYGPMGSPPMIGPNVALIFEIELFKVTPGEAQAPQVAPTH